MLWTHSIAQPKAVITAGDCWTIALDFGLVFAKFLIFFWSFGVVGNCISNLWRSEEVWIFSRIFQLANRFPWEGLRTLPLRRKMGYNSLGQKQQPNVPFKHHRQVSYLYQGASSGIQITLKESEKYIVMNDHWQLRIQNFSNAKHWRHQMFRTLKTASLEKMQTIPIACCASSFCLFITKTFISQFSPSFKCKNISFIHKRRNIATQKCLWVFIIDSDAQFVFSSLRTSQPNFSSSLIVASINLLFSIWLPINTNKILLWKHIKLPFLGYSLFSMKYSQIQSRL